MGVWRERNHANLKLVRAFVKKLREKLDDGPDPMGYILTEGRAGYRMVRPDELSSLEGAPFQLLRGYLHVKKMTIPRDVLSKSPLFLTLTSVTTER